MHLWFCGKNIDLDKNEVMFIGQQTRMILIIVNTFVIKKILLNADPNINN